MEQALTKPIKKTSAWADPSLTDVHERVQAGERLSREDGIRLFESSDILQIGYLANIIKQRKTEDAVYFITNRHVNYTNVCVNGCSFCAFSAPEGDPAGYTMSIADVLESAADHPAGTSEFHIVGGCHPSLPFSYYLEMIRGLKQAYPNIHIQAFTAVEIDHFSQISGLPLEDVIMQLKASGLGSLPGGGAEIFSDRTRQAACEKKIPGNRWLEVMRVAHGLGLRSNATMLYGHIENIEERVDHLLALRELQDETGGFQAFIPLPFHPKNTEMANVNKTSAVEDLKVLAISRLMLDNFDHIKAFWIMVGPRLAQVSLAFGVDDIDGTVVEEKITHAAGAETEECIDKETLIAMIKEMNLKAIERDTLYNVIKEYI